MKEADQAWGELGDPLPRTDPHGVSVHLPTWEATIGWVKKDPKLVSRMKTGYPRFYYHKIVVELTSHVRQKIDDSGLSRLSYAAAGQDYSAMLFPCLRSAYDLLTYFEKQGVSQDQLSTMECYFLTVNQDEVRFNWTQIQDRAVQWQDFEIATVVFPATKEMLGFAKEFWMHTGPGISSRYAEICLTLLQYYKLQKLPFSLREESTSVVQNGDATARLEISDAENGHVSVTSLINHDTSEAHSDLQAARSKIHLVSSIQAKSVLQDRLAILNSSSSLSIPPSNVLLYPTGMTALAAVAGALKSTTPPPAAPIVAFGFLYVDTFKAIERIHSFPTILHGQASASELDNLTSYLSAGHPIAGLFLEVPGNPLLKSPDLVRLRALANKYRFPIIIDDTIGTPVNVAVMHYADVVATSLTKMFSGACNTMGGSLVLNPTLPFCARLTTTLRDSYIDTYFPLDAEIMATNSADFSSRVARASHNAVLIADQLRKSPMISHVFYPKGSETQVYYDQYRKEGAGYGFLLSCYFKEDQAAVRFFDALETAKGPSLGTNFTLVCPYTLYGHWFELEWARRYGMGEFLVRMSIGLEDEGDLKEVVGRALRAVEGVGGRT